MKLFKIIRSHSAFYLGFLVSFICVAISLSNFMIFDKWNLMAESLDRGFVLSFAFINDWLNGGIQLWNRYNQLPYTYTHMQTGYYDMPKFISAIYFSIFNPGPNVGSDFRIPFINIYIGFSIFVKTLGIYLLIRRFTSSLVVIILGILYANTFFSSTYYVNLTTNNLFTFFPLLVHLILKFFETKKLTDFSWMIIIMAMLFLFSPYHFLNYVYISLHFFIISCILYYFLCSYQGSYYRKWIKEFIKRIHLLSFLFNFFNNSNKKSYKIISFRNFNFSLMLFDILILIFSFFIAFYLKSISKNEIINFSLFFVPFVSDILLIIGIYLLVNVLIENYANYNIENFSFNIVKIIISGLLLFWIIIQSESLNNISWKAPLLGSLLTTSLCFLIRYQKVAFISKILSNFIKIITNLFIWVKDVFKEFKNENLDTKKYPIILTAIGLCIIFSLPNILMIKDILPTLSYDGSRAESLSPIDYFSKDEHLSFGGIKALPLLSVNHLHIQDHDSWSVYWRSYMYIGFSSILLALLGIFCSQDKRKYIFLFSYLFILLLNWDIPKVANPVHIINAFTNPFAFTNRSFHFPIIALAPVFFIPLIVLGINAITELIKINTNSFKNYFRKINIIGILFFTSMLLLLSFSDVQKSLFIHISIIFFLFIVIAFLVKARFTLFFKRNGIIAILSMIFIIDCFSWSNYMNRLEPISTIRKLETPLFSDKGYVMDSVMPSVMPLREYLYNRPMSDLRQSVGINQDQNHGMFYQFVDLNRYLRSGDGVYFARHKSYDALAQNKNYSNYFNQVNQTFIKSNYAIIGDEKELNHVIEEELLDKIIVLNVNNSEQDQILKKNSEIISTALDKTFLSNQIHYQDNVPKKIVLPLREATLLSSFINNDYHLYKFDITEVPLYMSTMIATRDRFRFQASIGSNQLHAVQGEITEQYSFDVNNMIPGSIVFSFPKDIHMRNDFITLEFMDRFSSGVVDVYNNTNDNLGIVVDSESKGWLLYHAPYDKNWTATNNNNKTAIHKANGAFMALKLNKGLNRIEYSYMNTSWIDELILLSLISSLIVSSLFLFKTFLSPYEI